MSQGGTNPRMNNQDEASSFQQEIDNNQEGQQYRRDRQYDEHRGEYHSRNRSKERYQNNRGGWNGQGRGQSNLYENDEHYQRRGDNQERQREFEGDYQHSRNRSKERYQNNRGGWNGQGRGQSNLYENDEHYQRRGDNQERQREFEGDYQHSRNRGKGGYGNNSREQQHSSGHYNKQSWPSQGYYSGYDGNLQSPSQNPNQKRWDRQNSSSRWEEKSDIHLSKALSFLLRHGAEKQGFKLLQGGFLYIDEILRKVQSLRGYNHEDVMNVVENNDKKRFFVKKDDDGRYMIRANQGHTIEVEDLELTPITSAEELPIVIHGTYYKSWELIKNSGLCRMGRNHIHFAAGEPGENGVISGMRSSCEVMIFIDLEKALKDNLQFFRSANNVILSPGDQNGYIYPVYFQAVIQRYPRQVIRFDNTICRGSVDAAVSKKKKKNKKRDRGSDSQETPEKKESRLKSPSEPTQTWFDETSEDLNMGELYKDEGATCSAAQEDTKSGDVCVEADYEILNITSLEECYGAVETMKRSQSPMAVSCYGDELGNDGGKIEKIVCAKDRKVYVFHVKDDKGFMQEGCLGDLLTTKNPVKIIHAGAALSRTLFDQFGVILDGTDIFDTKVAYEFVEERGMGNLNELEEAGFIPGKLESKNTTDFNDGNQDEEKEKAKSLITAHNIMSKWIKDDKDYKRDTYKLLNSLIDHEKLRSFKKDKKKQEKAQCHASDHGNQKQGGKKNKKKK